MKMEESEVTRWLARNEASAYAPKFFDKGFYYVKDVTEQALKELIPDKPGLCSALSRLVKEANDMPVPEIPALPVGSVLDLSQRELKTPDGVKFEIPSALRVPKDSATVIPPSALKQEQWMIIARNSCMLYGRRMDGNVPAVAAYPALLWKITQSSDFMRSEFLAAEVSSELTFTERSSNYVSHGFTKMTATASFPFCSASVENEQSEKSAGSLTAKELFMIGIWHYPRARVLLDECTVVSPRFVREIMTALGLAADAEFDAYEALSQQQKQAFLDDRIVSLADCLGVNADKPSDPQRQLADGVLLKVEQVLNRYGHVIGMDVEVGGRLFFVHHKRITGELNSQEQKDVTKAAVSIKASVVKIGGGVATGSGEVHNTEAHDIAESVNFTALGGDTTLTSNPQDWAGSIKDPNLWAVIGLGGVVSTIDLLPLPISAFVHRLWKKYGHRGALDGRTVRLKAWLPQGENFVTIGDDGKNIVLVQQYEKYLPEDKTLWNIKCFKDDLYWFQHAKSKKVLARDPATNHLYGVDPNTMDDPNAFEAKWRIIAADAEGRHGDEYRNKYFIVHAVTELVLHGMLGLKKVPPKAPLPLEKSLVWSLDAVEDV